MATSTLSVPDKNLTSPASWGSRKAVANMVRKITTNYGTYLKFASDNSKIPLEILASFIAVESGGNATAGAEGHITQGLMQWNRNYASNTLTNEKKLGRLTADEESKLKEYNIKFDANNKTRTITNADQKKPELNILIGSIILGQLMDSYVNGKQDKPQWGTDANGNMRLDRIIACYNAGAFGETGKLARFGNYASPSALAKAVNPITRAYISKIYGINGAMDVATSDVKDAFEKLKV
jgi:hypothetical protein